MKSRTKVGHPYRLKSDQLVLEPRIAAVADVYGALTQDRSDRRGMAAKQALEIIAQDIHMNSTLLATRLLPPLSARGLTA
jgi:HD-GYP domain-containing protein (c-di-GMP phosphodiesterase class II)